MLYPLLFTPLFKERVWGGRRLEELFAKPLPPGKPIGESWEVTDRDGDVSVIQNGPLAGRSLHWLMENHPSDLLGRDTPGSRFPLLVKILDAQEKLSLQVHPPAAIAPRWNGEPKTEMWFIIDAVDGAELYVGLRRGVTRDDFERKLADGTVADCFHRVPVKAGDAMFVPSGRVHAIGAGCVLYEVQQNSDTTFRVFDWNRVGLDGKPRELHIPQSLASIDFDDVEPALIATPFQGSPDHQVRELVIDPLFEVRARRFSSGTAWAIPGGRLHILGMIEGELRLSGGGVDLSLRPGHFALVPAGLQEVTATARTDVHLLDALLP